MTKRELATSIVDMVRNLICLEGEEDDCADDNIIDSVEALLSPLHPKDRKVFSDWGHSHQRTTPEECWD